MQTLSIHDAQSRLAELVAKAEAGETVVLTRDGAPVADIRPHAPQPAAPTHGPAESSNALSTLLDRIAARAAAQPGAGEEMMRLLRDMRDDAP
jgi:prevent-host-death family protein